MAAIYNLDIVGVLEGTDKSSAVDWGWDYLRKYQTLFSHLRDEQFNLIEIGVLGGSSIRVWKQFFRKARIVGIDINPATAHFAEDRVTIEIGSQEDPAFLADVCAKYPPTIIIDDGSHLAHHIIYSFERLYPALLPGGLYVVEDLAFHSGGRAKRWRPLDGISPIDYFDEIIKACISKSLPSSPPAWGTQKYVFDNTDIITVINSAVVLQKRQPKASIEDAEAFADACLAANSYDSKAYGRLADYFNRHWRGSAQAEQAGRKAVDMNPDDPQRLTWLANFLFDKGRVDEAAPIYEAAVAAFSAAIEVNASREAKLGAYHHETSKILDRLGRRADALTYAEAAAKLVPTGHDSEAAYAKHLAVMRAKAAGCKLRTFQGITGSR